MNGLGDDIRLATRSLIRNPLISILAIVTLALGIGANTAIFSVLNATLLSPLPYPDGERLVAVWGVMPNRDIDTWQASPGMVDRYRREAGQFEDFAAAFGLGHAFRQRPDADPVQIDAVSMTWNLLDVLRVRPTLGRPFEPVDAAFNPDEVPEGVPPPANTFNAPNAVMLSHAFWRDQFGGDPDIVGSTVWLDNFPATVVGVTPPDFRLFLPGGIDSQSEILEVLRVDVAAQDAGANVFLNVIARLEDGVTLEQAQTEMDAITARLRDDTPIYRDNNLNNRLVPLKRELTQDIDSMLMILASVVALVLLIACANVANLLLVRGLARSRDQAIHSALGCGRLRMVRYGLIEAGLLAAIGGVVGVVLAWVSLPALVALQPVEIPRLGQLGVELGVLAFSALAVIAVTLAAGIAPAWLTANRNVAHRLRDRSGQQTSEGSRRWRNGLVVGEVALSLAVLVAAGLMLRSFAALNSADPGFEPEGVLTFNYVLPANEYPTPEEQLAFHREFHQRIENIPGVVEVGGVTPLPLTGPGLGSRYAADMTTFDDGSARQAQYRMTYPGYFDALETRVLEGRVFTQADQDGARNYAVVNTALAERAWPGESPIGKTLYIRRGDRPEAAPIEVIGVVEHQAVQALDEEPIETVFFPVGFAIDIGFFPFVNWTVKVDGDPMSFSTRFADALQELDPKLPLNNAEPLAEAVRESTAQLRFSSTLLTIFGLLALVLAVVGLYGVLAYRVRQRLPELGVRLAFGAAPARIFSLVVGQGMVLVGLGVAVGIGIALVGTRLLSAQLVDIGSADPVTYVFIIGLFSLVALAACSLPALRATRVDPVDSLRSE